MLIFIIRLDTSTIDKSKRAELLAYAALTGSYIAIWKGYFTIVPKMLSLARKMVSLAGSGATHAGNPSSTILAPLTSNINACSVLYSVSIRSAEAPADDIFIYI